MPPYLLLVMALAAGQAEGTVRGVLLEWDGDVHAGQLSLRAPDFHVHVFLLDSETLIEREGRNVAISALAPGDALEVICDPRDQSLRRYAHKVRVLIPAPPRRPPPAASSWPAPQLGGELFARGSLVVAGVVMEARPDHLRVRLRNGGERVILLRQDTRWLHDGLAVSAAELRVNTHVFIRAGRALEGGLEAYQVVWGRILRVP